MGVLGLVGWLVSFGGFLLVEWVFVVVIVAVVFPLWFGSVLL